MYPLLKIYSLHRNRHEYKLGNPWRRSHHCLTPLELSLFLHTKFSIKLKSFPKNVCTTCFRLDCNLGMRYISLAYRYCYSM